MENKPTPKRVSIYTDEGLIQRASILYGEAGVENYSQFVRKATEAYIDRLILGSHGPELSEAIRKAVADEVRPIATRLSKALYRYAVELDMLTQIIAYAEIPYDAMDEIRREANQRVARMRGRIDVKELLQEEHYKQLMQDLDDDSGSETF